MKSTRKMSRLLINNKKSFLVWEELKPAKYKSHLYRGIQQCGLTFHKGTRCFSPRQQISAQNIFIKALLLTVCYITSLQSNLNNSKNSKRTNKCLDKIVFLYAASYGAYILPWSQLLPWYQPPSKPGLSFTVCVLGIRRYIMPFLPHLFLLFQNPFLPLPFLCYFQPFLWPVPIINTNLHPSKIHSSQNDECHFFSPIWRIFLYHHFSGLFSIDEIWKEVKFKFQAYDN